MSILAATCATLATMLSLAQPGDTVKLEGECENIVIANRYERRVTIEASRAVVKGLQLRKAKNITWLGGVLAAPEGMPGFAYAGYALYLRDVEDVRIAYTLLTDAKKALVMLGSRNVVIEDNRFWRVREDGIIATTSANVSIDRNRFTDFLARPTQCLLSDGTVTYGLAKRDCPGTFTDGDHADAVQIYDGMTNVRVRWNFIAGVGQGIGQMEGPTSAPLSQVLIADNRVAATGGHQITLYACKDCRIERNVVRRGSDWKAIIREGTARRCGNDVQDQKADQACG